MTIDANLLAPTSDGSHFLGARLIALLLNVMLVKCIGGDSCHPNFRCTRPVQIPCTGMPFHNPTHTHRQTKQPKAAASNHSASMPPSQLIQIPAMLIAGSTVVFALTRMTSEIHVPHLDDANRQHSTHCNSVMSSGLSHRLHPSTAVRCPISIEMSHC
jgi:hypothetical protein